MGKVTHTHAFTNQALGEADSKELHTTVRASSRVMAIVTTVGAPSTHILLIQLEGWVVLRLFGGKTLQALKGIHLKMLGGYALWRGVQTERHEGS